MASVEEILMSRRTVNGCTNEVWAAKQAEEKKRKAEQAANNIQKLMAETEAKVEQLVTSLRAIREQEKIAKEALNSLGTPFLYAKTGLDDVNNIDVSKIAPLVAHLGLSLEDFGLTADVCTEIPENFTK